MENNYLSDYTAIMNEFLLYERQAFAKFILKPQTKISHYLSIIQVGDKYI